MMTPLGKWVWREELMAKALANGVPIGATLATDEVASAFTPGTHGSTFGGNPLATAVGVTVFSTLIEDKLAERAGRVGKVMIEAFQAIRTKHPKAVKEVRGRGLLAGFDLVPPVGDVVAACRERGLLVLTAGVMGVFGQTALFQARRLGRQATSYGKSRASGEIRISQTA
jgi:acetylornithine/succinyldiaminopimelate/putrescine aminotransferase